MLSEQYENTMNHYKLKRDQLQDLQIDVTNLEKALQNVTMTENSKLQSIQILEVKLKALNKDITEQEAKKTRAINTMNKMMKSKFNGVDPDSNEELADIKVRELKDKCNILITEVAKVGEMYPEVEEKIDLIFKQSNIQLPSKPVSRAGSRNSFASVSSSNLSSRAGSRAEIRSQPVSAIHSRRPSDAVRQGSITPKNLSFNDVAASSEKVQRGSTSSKLASARSLTTSRRASLTSGSAKGSDMMIDAKEVSRRSSSRNESS